MIDFSEVHQHSFAGASLDGSVYGTSVADCAARARERCDVYFGDVPYTIRGLDASPVETNGGKVLHYEARFTAVAA